MPYLSYQSWTLQPISWRISYHHTHLWAFAWFIYINQLRLSINHLFFMSTFSKKKKSLLVCVSIPGSFALLFMDFYVFIILCLIRFIALNGFRLAKTPSKMLRGQCVVYSVLCCHFICCFISLYKFYLLVYLACDWSL